MAPKKKPLVKGPRPKRPPSSSSTSCAASASPAAPTNTTTTATATATATATTKDSPRSSSKSSPTTSAETNPKSFRKITSNSLTSAAVTAGHASAAPQKANSPPVEAQIIRKHNPEFFENFSPIHDPQILAESDSIDTNALQIKCRITPDKALGDSVPEPVKMNLRRCGNEASVCQVVEKIGKFSPIHAPQFHAESDSIAAPNCSPSYGMDASQIKCGINPNQTLGDSMSDCVEMNLQKCEIVGKIEKQEDEGSARVNEPEVKTTVKFVKRKVPKRIEKGEYDCSDESVELSVPMQDVENSEFLVSAVKNIDPDVLVSRENFENTNYPLDVSMEVKKPNPIFDVSMEEVKNSNCIVHAWMEVKNPNPDVSVSMEEIENPNCAVTVSLKVADNAEVREGEQDGSVTEVPLEGHDDGDALKKPISVNDIAVNVYATVNGIGECVSDNAAYVYADADRNDECVSENATNVYAAVDESDECLSENVKLGVRGNEGVKEEVGKCDEGGCRREGEVGNGRVVSNRELEVFEWQRRRESEIFIGGLDKDVNKEDIRSVFNELGEIVEVRLITNKSGKNRGFAFVRFASAADAKNALEKYPKVEIFGKQCRTAHVEGNDTMFLGNIDKKWKNEDVIELLQMIGIEKIDRVTVMADRYNVHHNRGFAFVEFETSKDARIAYNKLKKEGVFGKLQHIKVAWAEPLNVPDEEEVQKVNLKASLAKPIPKGKLAGRVGNPISKGISKGRPKAVAVQCGVYPNGPRNKGISIGKNHETRKGDISSMNAELVQLLRKQASWGQSQTRLGMGSSDVDCSLFLPGMKRPLAALGGDSLYSDARGYTHACLESSFAIANPSYSRSPKDSGTISRPDILRQGAGHTSGYGHADYTNSFQSGPYHGRSGPQNRY